MLAEGSEWDRSTFATLTSLLLQLAGRMKSWRRWKLNDLSDTQCHLSGRRDGLHSQPRCLSKFYSLAWAYMFKYAPVTMKLHINDKFIK